MRIARPEGDYLLKLRFQSILPSHEKFSIGERIMVDDGEKIIGPFIVDYTKYMEIGLVAEEEIGYYYPIRQSDAELSDLIPYCDYEYEPISGNIYLDGFLGASYMDEHGIIRVDVSNSFPALKQYFSDLMDECGLEHRNVTNGFIIQDVDFVGRIFELQRSVMPIRYVIGYMSSFISAIRPRNRGTSKYAKYAFVLMPEEELYEEMAPCDMFYSQIKSQTSLFSYFGSLGPLSHYIDSEDKSEGNIFAETIHFEDIFQKTIKQLTFKLFEISGYTPRILDQSEDLWIFEVVTRDLYTPSKIQIAFVSRYGQKVPDTVRYALLTEDRTVSIIKVVDGQFQKSRSNLLYNDVFNFNHQLSDYFQILFKKM